MMAWDRGNAAPGTTTENNALTQWIQEQVKELYNINVEYVSVPRSESDDKLNIMMSGGTARILYLPMIRPCSTAMPTAARFMN